MNSVLNRAAPAGPDRRRLACLAVAVGLVVAALQFWLAAAAANDLPIDDQWDREGAWLYPRVVTGAFEWRDVLRPHNEHRIVWTDLLDLALFKANGQWDPRLEVLANVWLRAAVAGGFVALLISTGSQGVTLVLAGLTTVFFLPHLAWHNVIWGFQTQVYFSLGFSLLAFWLLGGTGLTWRRWTWGLLAGVAAQFAMGAGAFVPVALLALVTVEIAGRRKGNRDDGRRAMAAILLGGLALGLRVAVPAHAVLHATSVAQFFRVLGLGLAWPYPDQPWIALGCNLPLGWVVVARMLGKRPAEAGENRVLLLGAFGVVAAVAQAFLRGGGEEFAARVPSRYVDFLVGLVLANAWCLASLVMKAPLPRRPLAQLAGIAWLLLLAAGWSASSAETWRGVLAVRMAYRDVSVRLVRSFQETGDGRVFAGYSRLFVPHADPAVIGQVLRDPALKGKLPPSLQMSRSAGQLSQIVDGWFAHPLVLVLPLLLIALVLAGVAVRGSLRADAPPPSV